MTHGWRTPAPRLLIASVSAAVFVFLSFEAFDLVWFPGVLDPPPRFLLLRGLAAGSVLLLFALVVSQWNRSLVARETLRVLSENAVEGFISVDDAGLVREVNPAAERMLGYRHEELLGRPVELLMPERLRRAWQSVLQEWRDSGKLPDLSVPFEASALRRDGSEFPVELSVATWAVGRQRFFTGVVRDVSGRKRAEQELRESEARYRLLAENSTDVVVQVGMDGIFRYLSPSVSNVSDYTASELVGQSVYALFHTDDVDHLAAKHAANLLAGDAFRVEFRGRLKSGEYRWCEAAGKVLRDEQGTPSDAVTTVRDITDRKESEQRLAESEARFRFLAEHSTDLICRANMDAVVTYVSPAIRSLVGYEPEEVVGRSGYEFFDPADAEPAVLEHGRRLQHGGPFRVELRMRRKDGSPVWIEAAGQVVPGEAGVPAEVICVVRDVSERREMEERLRDSERRLKEAQAIAALGSWEWNVDTGEILWSDELYRVSGVDPRSFVPTPESTLALTHPEDLATLPQVAMLGEEEIEWQQRIVRPDGEVRWLSVRARRVEGAYGSLRILGASQDVTERKVAQEALLAKERELRLTLDHLSDMVTILDADGHRRYVSPSVEKLLGYTPDEYKVALDLDPSQVHPDDLPAVVGWYQRVLRSPGLSLTCECRLRHRDGAWRVVENVGQNLLEEPAIRGVVCTSRDVTARREAEEQLRESERRLREAQRLARVGSWEWNLETGELVWSPELFEICERDPATFRPTRETSAEQIHPDDLPATREMIAKVLRQSAPVEWEIRIFPADRSMRLLAVSARSVRDDPGEVRKIVGMVQDVTERRRAEDALRARDRQFRLALENLSDVIAIVDEDWACRYVSSSVERVLGYRPEEFIGKRRPRSEWRVVHPEDLPKVEAWLEAVRASGGGPVPLELRFRHKDGSWRIMEAVGQSLFHEPEINGLLFTTRDVTGRKEAEAAVRAAERKYRRLFEDSRDAIWMARPDGTLLELNPSGLEMLGYDGHTAIDGFALSPDVLDAETLERALHLVQAQGRLEEFECEVRTRGGQIRKMVVNAMPVTGRDGEIEYLHGISRDVTERRALEAQLRKSQKLEAIGRLAAGVAHEVNNPLTWVLSGLDGLRKDVERLGTRVGPAEAAALRETLEEVHLGADRVRRIVRDLHTFGRAEDEGRCPVDVGEVLRRAITMTSNEIRFRARLRTSLAETPPVIANEGRLLQVFLNLLINASQAVPSGDPASNEVVVETHREDGFVTVEVRDTGCGIAEENLARLFDPFFTTKPPGEGSGLGLSISHNIVTALGGRIDVESRVGAGARFVVRLPAAPAEALFEGPLRRDPPARDSGPAPQRRGRVLLVDDEPLIRSVAGRALRLDHEVVEAASGGEALAILERDGRFDAIVCDLMMPGVGGIEVYEALRGRSPSLSRRILFMTGGAFTPAARSFLDRVPNSTLEKPFEPPDLLRAVSTLLAAVAGKADA